MTISLFHPQSNGLAENGVKIVKNTLKSTLADEQNRNTAIHTILSRFMLIYRNTPHTTTKVSPAKALFGPELRTRFHLMTREDHIFKKYAASQVQGEILKSTTKS